MTNELVELQRWYAAQCNGEWEHRWGVHIDTLDNPGWRLKIDLTDTALEQRPFVTTEERSGHETQWVRCWIAEGAFQAAGGAFQLQRMIRIFLDWAA